MVEIRVKMLRAIGGFEVGDERIMTQAEADRLADRGVVRILAAKSEGASGRNKAEGASPRTKSAPATRTARSRR